MTTFSAYLVYDRRLVTLFMMSFALSSRRPALQALQSNTPTHTHTYTDMFTRGRLYTNKSMSTSASGVQKFMTMRMYSEQSRTSVCTRPIMRCMHNDAHKKDTEGMEQLPQTDIMEEDKKRQSISPKTKFSDLKVASNIYTKLRKR
ncbi:hypothetical protein SARC_00305, partial [Sphaeroforma arctica JP610]